MVSEQKDGFEDFLPRVLQIIAAGFLFTVQGFLSYSLDTISNSLLLFLEASISFTAILLILDAAVDYERYSIRFKSLFVFSLISISFLVGVQFSDFSDYQTDIMSFTDRSVDLLLDGENPYSSSMYPALEENNFGGATPLMGGGYVDSLSYPALSFLLFVPQILLGFQNLYLTSVVGLILIYLLLTLETPAKYSFLPLILLFVYRDFNQIVNIGVFEPLWILPLLLSMRYWYRENFTASYIFLGFSMAVKQIAWFVLPFLVVWKIKDIKEVSVVYEEARKLAVYGGGAFLIPNLPFIFINPVSWIKGVFTPLGAGGQLYPAGIGISSLSTSGAFLLPGYFYTLIMAAAGISAVLLYFYNFDRLKHLAWLSPMLILWFNSRSFIWYFTNFVIISYYLVLNLNHITKIKET